MVICLEGYSAVGNSTLCHALRESCRVYIIEETIVALLHVLSLKGTSFT